MFRKHKQHNHTMDGSFFVNGKGMVGIDLCSKDPPQFVLVNFTEEFNCHPCHPCNPHHDRVEWFIKEECGSFQLEIVFNVSNIREINYQVIYCH